MSDQWILSDDEENCPECEAAIERLRKLLREADKPTDWINIPVLNYLTDFDGEIPGAGGIIEIGRMQ